MIQPLPDEVSLTTEGKVFPESEFDRMKARKVKLETEAHRAIYESGFKAGVEAAARQLEQSAKDWRNTLSGEPESEAAARAIENLALERETAATMARSLLDEK